MIKIMYGHEKEGVEAFAKGAVSMLAKGDLEGFLGRFDKSFIDRETLYGTLRRNWGKGHIIVIDDPMDDTSFKANDKWLLITKTYTGYSLIYKPTAYGKSNGMSIEMEFITDKEMFFIVLESVRL